MTQYIQERVVHMERPITAWFLVGVATALILLYGYFVNASIINIVEAKSNQAKISALVSSVGAIESEYLSGKSALSIDYARSLGFINPQSDTIYIAKNSIESFSFNR